VENLEHNSKLLNDTVTPFSMVQHEYSRCTRSNSVMTVTMMQLVTLTVTVTAAFLNAISSFLQPATLQAITGSVTSGLNLKLPCIVGLSARAASVPLARPTSSRLGRVT
jgi:hypothetical protein